MIEFAILIGGFIAIGIFTRLVWQWCGGGDPLEK